MSLNVDFWILTHVSVQEPLQPFWVPAAAIWGPLRPILGAWETAKIDFGAKIPLIRAGMTEKAPNG